MYVVIVNFTLDGSPQTREFNNVSSTYEACQELREEHYESDNMGQVLEITSSQVAVSE